MTNTSFDQIGAVIRDHNSFAVGSHVRPDGDAIGSALALADSLRAQGKSVIVLNQDGTPENLAFLPASETVQRPADNGKVKVDVFIALDTANRSRLGEGVLESVEAGVWVNIDHHISNPGYGDIAYIDSDSPATGQIVYQLLIDQNMPVPAAARDNLYVAISTDTGSFQYPNTTATTYRIAAELIDAGADVGDLSQKMYESYPFRRLQLMGELLSVLRRDADGRLATWALTQDVVKGLGLKPEDSEGLIDVIRAIDGVIVAIFFEELDDGRVRVSMRSKSRQVDVCEICQEFGGGGHSLAAGARLRGPLQEAQKRVLNAAINAIENG